MEEIGRCCSLSEREGARNLVGEGKGDKDPKCTSLSFTLEVYSTSSQVRGIVLSAGKRILISSGCQNGRFSMQGRVGQNFGYFRIRPHPVAFSVVCPNLMSFPACRTTLSFSPLEVTPTTFRPSAGNRNRQYVAGGNHSILDRVAHAG